jgi:hypothetical protein
VQHFEEGAAKVWELTKPKIFDTGDTGLHIGTSRGMTFSGFHVLAQDGVDCGLVAAAVLAEECQHIGIDAQGNLLLWALAKE